MLVYNLLSLMNPAISPYICCFMLEIRKLQVNLQNFDLVGSKMLSNRLGYIKKQHKIKGVKTSQTIYQLDVQSILRLHRVRGRVAPKGPWCDGDNLTIAPRLLSEQFNC